MVKTAAVVILYYPEQSFDENIKSYIDYVGKFYLIDNSEHKSFNLQSLSAYQSKIIIIHDRLNHGIAKRLNQACDLAIKEGFEFLLTMDQDSCFDELTFKNYLNCIAAYQDKTIVSMFGINHEKQLTSESCISKKTNTLITSGSIINLSAYKIIGSFDENLFIDFVDTEYCFRSIQKGYDVIEFPNIFMHHQIGETTKHRSFKNIKLSNRSIHSATRLYYMTRNFLYLNKKYNSQFKEELSIYKKDLLTRIKNKLLYQNNRYKILNHLIKAFSDYRNNKMGKQL